MQKKIKPLLFVLDNGTFGDVKPLAILAVHAAHAAHTLGLENMRFSMKHVAPVTLVCEDSSFAPLLPSINQFAEYMIGPDYKLVLDIQFREMDEKQRKKYAEFTQEFHETGAKKVFLDFGDNESKNRFTSRILKNFRPKSTFFGSLFLPVSDFYAASGDPVFWSSPQTISALSDFASNQHEQSSKIITIAGSMQTPFPLQDIYDWLTSEKQKDWSVLLVGYNNAFKKPTAPNFQKFKHRFKAMESYVEYEDCVRVADFFVSNCGAGSTILPIAVGCPQMCRIRIAGIQGTDKRANAQTVSDVLKLGPNEYNEKTEANITFQELMQDLSVNIDMYTKNAMLAQKIVDEETEEQNVLLFDFFTEMLTSTTFQAKVLKTGIIPSEFALSN